MRKAFSLFLVWSLLLGLPLQSSTAAEKKRRVRTVTEQWQATALPGPRNEIILGGCQVQGVEGVTRVTKEFVPPGKGVLAVTIGNFIHDWDVWVVSEDGRVLEFTDTLPTQFNSTEERLGSISLQKGQKVMIMACNVHGGPTADLSLVYQYVAK